MIESSLARPGTANAVPAPVAGTAGAVPDPVRDVIGLAQRLRDAGRSFALVTVVRALSPASARAGDKAIVDADRVIQGWVGGGCAQPLVLRTVREALVDGRARLIRIAPSARGDREESDGLIQYDMACHSGGVLELFIDPMLPRARLTIIGDTPVAAALAALAPRVGFGVTVVAHEGDPDSFPDAEAVLVSDACETVRARVAPGSDIVVATQGRRDLEGLRLALALAGVEVSLVASARKAAALRLALLDLGESPDAVAAIIAPAGQPIAAQTQEEIALSVLAAVVASRRARHAPIDATRAQVRVAEVSRLPLPEPAEAPLPARHGCCGG